MIEILEVESPRVIAIRIAGKIERADIDQVIDLVERKLETEAYLNAYVEVESIEGISFDALLEDLKFVIPHIKDFKKKAVVSNLSWAEKMVRLGNQLFSSIEVRHFSPEEKWEALSWASV